jgi:hypothetical protein
MCDQQAKNGNFDDYEFPKSWSGEYKIDWINDMLANKSGVASVELCLDEQDDVWARVWFRKA